MRLLRIPRSDRHYVHWRDHRGRHHRWAAFKNEKLSESWGRKLESLAEYRAAREPLPPELKQWAKELAPHRLAELIRLEVLADADLGRKSLETQLGEYEANLKALGRKPRYIKLTLQRARAMLTALGVSAVDGLDDVAVVAHMRKMRETLSAQSVNHYLIALKQFANWCVERGYAASNPIRRVKKLNVAHEGRKRVRRVLTGEQINRLLSVTDSSNLRYGLTGAQRAWVYQFDLMTGLRFNELRLLTVGDIKAGTVTVRAETAKSKQERKLPLGKRTIQAANARWRGKDEAERAFKLPGRPAEMLGVDLELAGIKVDDGRGVLDFHALRHTFASMMEPLTSRSDLMALLGHSDGSVTSRYTHADVERMRKAVEKLEGLTLAVRVVSPRKCSVRRSKGLNGPQGKVSRSTMKALD